MSTTITSINTQMLARLAAIFTTHQRIPNPHEPEFNPVVMMRAGYGIVLGGGNNSNRHVGDKISIARQVTIVLSREMAALENDAAARANAEVALFEDQVTLIKDFMSAYELNGSNGIIRTDYQSDTGPQLLDFGNEGSVLVTNVTFETEYFENLT